MTETRALRKGLSLYPSRPVSETRRLAKLAEEKGYSHLWFGDSQNIWREAYVSMAASAVDTSRVVIGTAVTNGVTRHRSVIASGWATLSELAPGRVAAGFGVGDSALHTMGASPMKVAELERLVADLRSLWSGAEVNVPDTEHQYRLAYLTAPTSVPVYIAASGPRLLKLAAKIADGIILLVGTDPAAVEAALKVIREGAAEAGRQMGDIDIVLWAPAALDDDPDTARDRVRAHVSRTVLRPIQVELSDRELEAIAAIRAHYDYYDHMVPGSDHSRLVINELVDRFALAGNAVEVAERLENLANLGVTQVGIIPFGPSNDSIDQVISDFAALA